MLFPTFTFGVFFLVVYGLHVGLRSRVGLWKPVMLVASFIFYGWINPRWCALLALSILLNYGMGAAIHAAKDRPRELVGIAVMGNLLILGLFKYWGFFVESTVDLFGTSLPLTQLALPIGISFFTFQGLSYVIDIHRRKLEPVALTEVALYLAFFPQLVAGPIVRATEFLPQLQRRSLPNMIPSGEAAWLIGRGMFKKVVLANYLAAAVVDVAYTNPNEATRAELITAFYGYAIQIYADFSGYTDIAIGVALLLGFRFPENFDAPYRSLSIQEFWRRWHMTLSRWLRDYLYISLGGNRKGNLFTYRNLLLTMVLGGLWHGAGWNFILWGTVHGAALAIERLLQSKTSIQLPTFVRWLVTFHIVAFAWVLFRAENLSVAQDLVRGMFSNEWGTVSSLNTVAIAIIVVALVAQLLPRDLASRAMAEFVRLDPLLQGAALGVWLFVVAYSGPPGAQPFIYFQF